MAQKKEKERVVELYDPHPGKCALAGPIPPQVKHLADQMAGERVRVSELEDVVKKIQAATEGAVKIMWKYSYIQLKVGEKIWRVLRFR